MQFRPGLRALVLVLAALTVVAFGAPSAHATTTNLIATNAAGEPLDDSGITTVTTADELWAYVTTPTGTILCAHSLPVEEGATCEEAGAWGGGSAPALFAGYVPVA